MKTVLTLMALVLSTAVFADCPCPKAAQKAPAAAVEAPAKADEKQVAAAEANAVVAEKENTEAVSTK